MGVAGYICVCMCKIINENKSVKIGLHLGWCMGSERITLHEVSLKVNMWNAWSVKAHIRSLDILVTETSDSWMNHRTTNAYIYCTIYSYGQWKWGSLNPHFLVSCARCWWNSVQRNKHPLFDACVLTLIIIIHLNLLSG